MLLKDFSSFRAVSEQSQSSFREQFHRAISEQFQRSFRAVSEQFQSSLRADNELTQLTYWKEGLQLVVNVSCMRAKLEVQWKFSESPGGRMLNKHERIWLAIGHMLTAGRACRARNIDLTVLSLSLFAASFDHYKFVIYPTDRILCLGSSFS